MTEIQNKILAATATVTEWATARVESDRKAELAVIQDFYDDYHAFCRERKAVALPRKGWLQVVKLAGFRTESGGFKGIRLADLSKLEVSAGDAGVFATITRDPAPTLA